MSPTTEQQGGHATLTEQDLSVRDASVEAVGELDDTVYGPNIASGGQNARKHRCA